MISSLPGLQATMALSSKQEVQINFWESKLGDSNRVLFHDGMHLRNNMHLPRSQDRQQLAVEAQEIQENHCDIRGFCPQDVPFVFQNLLCVRVLMTGTFEALAILFTMITQSQKECQDRIHSLCQWASHFVLQYRAKAMKDHCVNICEKHSPVSHDRGSGYLYAANPNTL